MLTYSDFKGINRVTNMSKEDIFYAAYHLGLNGRTGKEIEADKILREIGIILSDGYPVGRVGLDKIKDMLQKISKYDSKMVVGDYTKKYLFK